MNKYEIENILQTKPKKSAREFFFQGRWKCFRTGKSSRSPALQGRWFQMLTLSPDFLDEFSLIEEWYIILMQYHRNYTEVKICSDLLETWYV